MFTYVIYNSDGSTHSVRRSKEQPKEFEIEAVTPEGGFFIDLTGQESFDTMDLLEIHEGYRADPETKRLIKIEA